MINKRPNSRRNLDVALERFVGKADFLAKRAVLANAIVAQMLPDGTVKGGSAIKMRFGDATTRFTTDLDIARAIEMSEFRERFELLLSSGWEGFTGTLVEKEQAHPQGIPSRYVMQPFSVKLSYNSKPWVSVLLEVGHNEIGDAEDPEYIVPEDANGMLEALGFPSLDPVPVMPLHHQIAQKLHAASAEGSMRAHDLIDLQLIAARADINFPATRRTCERLFAYRKAQEWPPLVVEQPGWKGLYKTQADGLPVLQDVGEAVIWTNELIAKIDLAR